MPLLWDVSPLPTSLPPPHPTQGTLVRFCGRFCKLCLHLGFPEYRASQAYCLSMYAQDLYSVHKMARKLTYLASHSVVLWRNARSRVSLQSDLTAGLAIETTEIPWSAILHFTDCVLWKQLNSQHSCVGSCRRFILVHEQHKVQLQSRRPGRVCCRQQRD